ncbi:CRISPR-associated endoribonuclease Cas6 [Anaerovorax odorimutans]|uniref:CRISPR-associated endoribonuclease Cas6 n=1 Tax=Anaerovorax odorimutans TaxID=109327 RepID=UPI0004027BA3|nr:CRISPR-associated endoribonuclease Cas6 [Anaerovorax odorimutans]
MDITVYELRVKVYLYQNIKYDDCMREIAKLIDTVLAKKNKLRDFHEQNCFKNYVFGGFSPFESDKLYKKDGIYKFQLRTVNDKLVNYFSKRLEHFRNEYMNVLTIQIKKLSKKYINKIYSLTPIILKDYDNDSGKSGYWKTNFSVDYFQRRIIENLIKKYNAFTGEKLNEDFQMLSNLEFKNQSPIPFPYKNIKLLGDKTDLIIESNDAAQQLSYFALGVGLGECNARGAGFVNFKSL